MKFFLSERWICIIGVICTLLCAVLFYQTLISTAAAWTFQLYATSQWGKPFSYKNAYLKNSKLVIEEPNYDNQLSFSAHALILDFNINWVQYRLDIAVEVNEPKFRFVSPLNPQKELKSLFSNEKKWFRTNPRFHIQKGLVSWYLADQARQQISFDFDGSSDDGGILTLYFDPENIELNFLQFLVISNPEMKKIKCRSVQSSFRSLCSFVELFGIYSEDLVVDSGVFNGEAEAIFPKRGKPYLEANISVNDIIYRYSSERSMFSGQLPEIQLTLKRNPMMDQSRGLHFPVIGALEILSLGTIAHSSASEDWRLDEVAGFIKLDEAETIRINLSANHYEDSTPTNWVFEGLANLSESRAMHFDGSLLCSTSSYLESQSHFHLRQLADEMKYLDIKLHKFTSNECKFLKAVFAHFYPAVNRLSINKGKIDAHIEADFKETYRDQKLKIDYTLKNLVLENDDLLIEMGAGDETFTDQCRGFHEVDLATYSHHGTMPLFHGSYLIKSKKLLFEEVFGLVAFEDNIIRIESLEGYCTEAYFAGSLAMDFRDTSSGALNLSINFPTLSAKLSQIQRFFEHFQQTSIFSQIPFESTVTARNKGIVLNFAFLPNDYTLEADIQGSLVDGFSLFEGSDISLKGIYADIDYQHHNETIELTDIQGTLLVGKPRRVEEYLFVGDHLRIEHFTNPDLSLDVSVKDGSDELLRFVGRTSDASVEGLKNFYLDSKLSHFSCIYPQEWLCTVKNWSSIETFHFLSHFDIQTFIKDFQLFRYPGSLFLTPPMLEKMSREPFIDSQGTIILGYEPMGHHFSYYLEAARNGNEYGNEPFATLCGRKLEKKWLIDKLQWKDWTAYAELQHEEDKWKIPFLGLNREESFLAGLEGEFIPDEGRLYAKVNLCKVNLSGLKRWDILHDFVDRWSPEGHLRMSGELEWNAFKNDLSDRCAGHFQAEMAELSIRGNPIVRDVPFQFDFSHDGSDLQLRMYLESGSYKFKTHEIDINNFNFLIAGGEMNFSFQTRKKRYPFHVKGSVPWPSCHSVNLTLIDSSTGNSQAQPLEIRWGKNRQGGLSIQSLRGAFGGCLFNLEGEREIYDGDGERKNGVEAFSNLIGDVSVDFNQLTPLLNLSAAELINNLKLRSIYTFRGRLSLIEDISASFFDSVYFNGELFCEEPVLKGYQFQSLHGKFQYRPQRFELQNLKIEDTACQIQVSTLSITRDSEQAEWSFFIPKINVKNFRPSLVRELDTSIVQESEKLRSLVVKRFDLTDFGGELHNIPTWQGKGSMHFVNPVKKSFNHPLFAIPAELIMRLGLDPQVMNPVTGTIYFDLRGNRFYLNRFKDVYSEGRGSKFILAEGTSSWMDLDGNLSIRIKMKQYNLFFKITELFTVLVHGNIRNPHYQLLQGERLHTTQKKWGK